MGNLAYSYNSNGTLTLFRGAETKQFLNIQMNEFLSVIDNFCAQLNPAEAPKSKVKPKLAITSSVESKPVKKQQRYKGKGNTQKGKNGNSNTATSRNHSHHKRNGGYTN